MTNRVTIDNLDVIALKGVVGDYQCKCSYVGNEQYNIAMVPCGFDIETTRCFMYIWTCSINETTIIGYTWDDFRRLLEMLEGLLDLGPQYDSNGKRKVYKVMPLFIHNLGGFEYHFMEKELNITNCFKAQNKALYAIVDKSFLLLDSYRICPQKLEVLAEMYSRYRKTHDLDYSVDRNTTDAKNLSDDELTYCCNDTLILVDFAQFCFDFLCKWGKLPTTQNDMVKAIISYHFKRDKNNQEVIKGLFPPKEIYEFVRQWGFRGGFCQTSYREVNDSVVCFDFDSAYCSSIVHDYFPMGRYRKGDPKTWREYLDKYCCQMTLKFTNLRSRVGTGFIHYETIGHCFFDKGDYKTARHNVKKEPSGRVISAPYYYTSLTEVDFELYTLIYEWDSVECLRFVYAERGALPEYVIQTAIELYEPKARLKAQGKEDTPEYRLVKSRPSTIFGCMCQRLYDSDIEGLDSVGWYKKFKTKKLMPQWGVYITAHIRKRLITMALSLGAYYWLYSDTDSIYCICDDEVRELFEEYNEAFREKNRLFCEQRGLDYDVFKNLGCFDDGSRKGINIFRFKTISAKTYIYYYTDNKHPEGAVKVVIGGIPEEDFWDSYELETKDYKHEDIPKIFDFFESETIINYHKRYTDIVENKSEVINGERMFCKQGVVITDEYITGPIRTVRDIVAIQSTFSKIEDKLERDII